MDITYKRSVTINVGNFQVVTVGCEIKDQLYKGEDELQATDRIKNYVVSLVNKDIQDINKIYKVKHPLDTTLDVKDDVKVDVKAIEAETEAETETEPETEPEAETVDDRGVVKEGEVVSEGSGLVINRKSLLLKLKEYIVRLQDTEKYNKEYKGSIRKLYKDYEITSRKDLHSLSLERLSNLTEEINKIFLSSL